MRLDRLVAVLEAVAAAGRPLSAAELQAATGLPRPTCYRLLQALAEQGLLEDREHNSRYQIGERFRRIALAGISDADARRAAAPMLRDVASHLGEATFLSRYRNDGVEIIHVETPADPKRAFMHPGLGFRPMHACSCSKAIAAFADPTVQEAILAGPMKAYTPHTKTRGAALREEFALIRARGYAECIEEIETGVSSVAAPVTLSDAGAPFSIGAIGPVRRFTAGYRARVGAELIGRAAVIARALRLSGALEAG